MPKTKTLIPDKAWVDFTAKEQSTFKKGISHLLWKNEGPEGPLYVIFKEEEKDDFFMVMSPISRRFKDGYQGKDHIYAHWYSQKEAERMAKIMEVKLKTC